MTFQPLNRAAFFYMIAGKAFMIYSLKKYMASGILRQVFDVGGFMDEDMLFFKETPFPELPLWNQDEFLWIFKEALQHGTGIKMTYESADGSLFERTVFPEVLFFL